MLRKALLSSFIATFLLLQGLHAQQTSVTYQPGDEDIVNPERGFYKALLSNEQKNLPLKLEELQGFRNGFVPFSGCPFKVNSVLILRHFELRGFQHKPLSAEVLQNIDNDFATARTAGVKLIVRFSYFFSSTPDFKPPYNDAPLDVVLGHIAQLKPILQKNADVIATAQMGFIGLWGEGYYSDYYGRPETATDQNIRDRAAILKAFLQALPAPIMVQVRHPSAKQQFSEVGGAPELLNRIGFYNEAFLSSADDMGTFRSYDASAQMRSKNTKAVLMGYVEEQTANTVMSGETAGVFAPYDKCSSEGGQAEAQLSRFHFSFLNSNYHQAVLTSWAPCIDDIKRKLGYRLVLEKASYPAKVMRKDVFSIQISFSNEGYAAPFNPKEVSLILVSEKGSKTIATALSEDTKTWDPGRNSLKAKFYVSDAVPEGKYKLYLKVADTNDKLASRSEYCIRFANKGTWNQDLGANDLQYSLSIDGTSTKPTDTKKFKSNKIMTIQ